MTPRVIRQRAAAEYLGMDRNRFDLEVRPQLTEVPIGAHGIGYDREDLDAWFDAYKATHGRPGRIAQRKKEAPCEPAPVASSSYRMARDQSISDTPAAASTSGLAPSRKKPLKPGSSAGSETSTSSAKTSFDRAMSACSLLERQST